MKNRLLMISMALSMLLGTAHSYAGKCAKTGKEECHCANQPSKCAKIVQWSAVAIGLTAAITYFLWPANVKKKKVPSDVEKLIIEMAKKRQ